MLWILDMQYTLQSLLSPILSIEMTISKLINPNKLQYNTELVIQIFIVIDFRKITINRKFKTVYSKSQLVVCILCLYTDSIWVIFWLYFTTFWFHFDCILTLFWLHSDSILTVFWLFDDSILTLFNISPLFWLYHYYDNFIMTLC